MPCPICLTSTDLVSDHDHITGFSREHICRRCNVGLGMFRDNAAALRRAARYLAKHRAIHRTETIRYHFKPSDMPRPTRLEPLAGSRAGKGQVDHN